MIAPLRRPFGIRAQLGRGQQLSVQPAEAVAIKITLPVASKPTS